MGDPANVVGPMERACCAAYSARMASRIGGGSPPPFLPPAGATPDNRLEQMRERQLKELLEQRTVRTRDEGEHVLNSIAKSLKNRELDPGLTGLRVAPLSPDGQPIGKKLDTRSERAPTPNTASGAQDLARLVADFQRQSGLPVTGHLDATTVTALKDKGLLPPPPPTASDGREQAALAPRAGKDDVAATRQSRAAAEQQTRQRVGDGAQTPRSDKGSERARAERGEATSSRASNVERGVDAAADRVVDPARLLASLLTAGFGGKGKAGLEEALKAFQHAQGLPVTGALDHKTQESLKRAKLVEPEQAPTTKTSTDKPVEPKQQVRRALTDSAPTTKQVADREVNRDPVRPQASTAQATTSADVAARAPVTSSSDAAERARLDTVLAQQAASERGVQEGTGDPAASQGHGATEGVGAGQQGAEGASGGGAKQGQGPGATGDVDGPVGDETAVGNAEAGDDDFNDEERGNANARGDGEHADEEAAFWLVPPLSAQVHAALEAIARDDDGTGPVSYSWDVTFMRPGTYAAGQPAEALWHVAVTHATAFDPVWQTAADAISSRMLYSEPDADPPTIDDFIMALRRARVR